MTPEEILSYPSKVLSDEQREYYFKYGFLGVKDLVPKETLNKLKDVTNQFVEKSREVSESNNVFDIGPGHSKDNPILRRLKTTEEKHEE